MTASEDQGKRRLRVLHLRFGIRIGGGIIGLDVQQRRAVKPVQGFHSDQARCQAERRATNNRNADRIWPRRRAQRKATLLVGDVSGLLDQHVAVDIAEPAQQNQMTDTIEPQQPSAPGRINQKRCRAVGIARRRHITGTIAARPRRPDVANWRHIQTTGRAGGYGHDRKYCSVFFERRFFERRF